MGKTTRWLRSLFSTSRKPSPSSKPKAKAKANWATSDGVLVNNPYGEGQLDANKHAIAVAAATAAVAEAALAAAQAAAEVVRLTSGGVSARNDGGHDGGERRRVVAAVKIQSAFRAYLAKRALRALKGLVKLQALVRGHIVRKQSADMLRRMQAMARIQARASVHRSYLPEPTNKFNFSHHPFVTNQRHYDQHLNNPRQSAPILKQYNPISQKGGSSHQTSNWLHHWMDQYAWNTHHGDDERTDKILEIDTWKPRQPIKRPETTTPTSQHLSWSETARLSAKLQKPSPSVSSEEVSSAALSLKYPQEGDQGGAACTTENSPRVHSTLSKHSRGPFTPTKSDTRSLFGNYVGHPSYMANTASSRAKVRSQSAPKQRMQLEELGRSHGLWEPDSTSEMGFPLPSNYRSNTAYLNYSGQLRRQGTPARGAYTGFSSTYGHRL